MFKIKQKNDWAIDIFLHIPLPSFAIQITKNATESEVDLNTPLHRTSAKVMSDSHSVSTEFRQESGPVAQAGASSASSQSAESTASSSASSASSSADQEQKNGDQ